MKRIRFLLIFYIVIFTVHHVDAQKYTISGYVQDMRSGEKIYSANVYDLRTKL